MRPTTRHPTSAPKQQGAKHETGSSETRDARTVFNAFRSLDRRKARWKPAKTGSAKRATQGPFSRWKPAKTGSAKRTTQGPFPMLFATAYSITQHSSTRTVLRVRTVSLQCYSCSLAAAGRESGWMTFLCLQRSKNWLEL